MSQEVLCAGCGVRVSYEAEQASRALKTLGESVHTALATMYGAEHTLVLCSKCFLPAYGNAVLMVAQK